MKYIKLYEEFNYDVIEPELQTDLSDKDTLESDEVYKDENGVYHIKNWMVY